MATGVLTPEASLCRPDGAVAVVGMAERSELVVDLGAAGALLDAPGGDFYFYERLNRGRVLMDLMEISVAPDNGAGAPGEYVTVFVWGDGDPSNNGAIPPWQAEEVERILPAAELHRDHGIGIDIGRDDGAAYRFVRFRTFPHQASPGLDLGVEVDAIERASFPMPPWVDLPRPSTPGRAAVHYPRV